MSKLKVTLSHQVPPQHMVETCAGSRGPTKEQKKIIEKLGLIKYGKFTPEEDNIIMRNWKSFCKVIEFQASLTRVRCCNLVLLVLQWFFGSYYLSIQTLFLRNYSNNKTMKSN